MQLAATDKVAERISKERVHAGTSPIEKRREPQLKDELRAQGLKVGGRKAELIERLLGPGEIMEDELDLDCDVPQAVTAMTPTVLIEACKS